MEDAKSKEQGTVLLQRGLIRFCDKQSNKEAYLWTVSCGIQSDPTVTVLYLVSLLFAPPFLHSTNHFLDRKVLDCDLMFVLLSGDWFKTGVLKLNIPLFELTTAWTRCKLSSLDYEFVLEWAGSLVPRPTMT